MQQRDLDRQGSGFTRGRVYQCIIVADATRLHQTYNGPEGKEVPEYVGEIGGEIGPPIPAFAAGHWNSHGVDNVSLQRSSSSGTGHDQAIASRDAAAYRVMEDARYRHEHV